LPLQIFGNRIIAQQLLEELTKAGEKLNSSSTITIQNRVKNRYWMVEERWTKMPSYKLELEGYSNARDALLAIK